jgi:tetratricopeptide (TPR) repeat protein
MTAASVSLCLIVRNEEDCLADCLRSAADLVREIIVVDTGSADRSREVAAAAGAKVVEFAWSDSFAATRNESLRHASGDWISWLDADERLDEENRQRLRTLFAGLGDDNAAYTMTQQSELEASTYSTTRVDYVRLFCNHPQIRWDYRVHEQILPAIRAAGGELRRTDIVIHHAGFRDPARQEAKVDRNLRLLLMEAQERPGDEFLLFNLGSVYLGCGQGEAALPLLQRSLSLSRPDDTIVPKLYALITRCQHQLGRLPDALAVCRAGRQACPGAVELLFWEGLLRELGDAVGAATCLERVLETRLGTCFTGVDAGVHGYKARQCLAEIYRTQGRDDRAEAQWREVLAEQPRYAPARLGLAELFVEQRRIRGHPLPPDVPKQSLGTRNKRGTRLLVRG